MLPAEPIAAAMRPTLCRYRYTRQSARCCSTHGLARRPRPRPRPPPSPPRKSSPRPSPVRDRTSRWNRPRRDAARICCSTSAPPNSAAAPASPRLGYTPWPAGSTFAVTNGVLSPRSFPLYTLRFAPRSGSQRWIVPSQLTTRDASWKKSMLCTASVCFVYSPCGRGGCWGRLQSRTAPRSAPAQISLSLRSTQSARTPPAPSSPSKAVWTAMCIVHSRPARCQGCASREDSTTGCRAEAEGGTPPSTPGGSLAASIAWTKLRNARLPPPTSHATSVPRRALFSSARRFSSFSRSRTCGAFPNGDRALSMIRGCGCGCGCDFAPSCPGSARRSILWGEYGDDAGDRGPGSAPRSGVRAPASWLSSRLSPGGPPADIAGTSTSAGESKLNHPSRSIGVSTPSSSPASRPSGLMVTLTLAPRACSLTTSAPSASSSASLFLPAAALPTAWRCSHWSVLLSKSGRGSSDGTSAGIAAALCTARDVAATMDAFIPSSVGSVLAPVGAWSATFSGPTKAQRGMKSSCTMSLASFGTPAKPTPARRCPAPAE